jgi:hypothetical protein
MLLFILMFKAVVEVALFAFIGQGILYIIAGAKRESNFVFTLLKLITAPMVYIVRFISPRIILDRHVPLATFLFLCTLWFGLTVAKVQILLQTK